MGLVAVQNEFWFPYTILIINLLIIWFMPKRIAKQEIYILWFALAAIALYTDVLFGVVLDLFDYGKSPKVVFLELPIEALLPPSFGIIFLNYMPKDRMKYLRYMICWVVFSTFFEWITVCIDYLSYKGWKLWYSAVIYTIVFIFIRWHYYFIRRVLKVK
ncbi:hypothetical protein J2Z37_004876 [Ammoniphilus resinae]|uniref:Rod shape-determining protein MreD n=2 Tax=Ammoniphilus resinae TaxID=861532 RepID=A0ABS4GX85_9BACL|nr:hypothetical protein [Ammoniphilus resinae]